LGNNSRTGLPACRSWSRHPGPRQAGRPVLQLGLIAVVTALPLFPQTFAISQARADPPSFTLFLEATGSDGQPLPVSGPGALKATFGEHPLTVTSLAPFDPATSGVAYIVLVDVSKSLGPREFAQVRAALGVLTDHLGPRDRMAIVTFGSRVQIVSDFTADRDALKSKIQGLAPTDNQTFLHLALRQAIDLGKRLDPDLPARRAAIVLTDGKDEGSGITIDDVLADVRENRLPFYAIGFSRLPAPERARYFDLLKRLAIDSGGRFFEAANAVSIARAYADTRAAITGVLVARLNCPACAATGRIEHLQVTLNSGDRVLTDGIDLRILPAATPAPAAIPRTPPPPPRPLPWYRRIPMWAYIAGGSLAMVAMAVLLLLFEHRRQKRKKAPQPSAEPVVALSPAVETPEPAPPPSPAVPLEFVVVRGQRPGTSYRLKLDRRAVIGTAADSDLRLTSEPSIAAHQFELERSRGRIIIRDLSGSQGTSVNGVPLRAQYPIAHGDVISVGVTELRVLVSS
jgi:von Willebrand factor type A domain/FHA domain